MKVLIVDDDADLLPILAEMLRCLGHEVTAAVDGREGLQLCRSTQFDLVLTDLVMPNKGGVEMIQAIRRFNATTKIIAMSGGYRIDSLDMIAASRAMGADEVLYKPFGAPELQRAIQMVQAM